MDISALDDIKLVKLIENRWKQSSPLWGEMEKVYKKNLKQWRNNPEYLERIPKKKSKARDNRTFLATETVITNLTGRPSKPNVIPANDSADGKEIANDLQEFYIEKYKELKVKSKMRKGLRHLFLSRLIVLKVFWNNDIDDFDVKPILPTKVRFAKTATNSNETDFAIEKVVKPIMEVIALFPDKEEKILKNASITKENAIIENPDIAYYEAWVGDYVIYKFENVILKKEKNPYWDWNGVEATEQEMQGVGEGKARRTGIQRLKTRGKEEGVDYESYLYNHFDKPKHPYIFGTILGVEDKPIGDTSLIEQVSSLQFAIDERKRQFSDNAKIMNGVWKVDTGLTQLSKADAQMMKADPEGIIYGKGVANGVIRETGKELPLFLKDDMIHSIMELDSIFGTSDTMKGQQGKQETATGRAILREQGYQRLDELINLVDDIHLELYNWWFQMIKVRYTEKHYIKSLGADKTQRVIELMQDDLEEGIEIKIIPGQILPEDRFYKAEIAKEATQAGLMSPLSYFEKAEFDNPMEEAKRLEMYKVNPFSIIDMDEEDIKSLQQSMQLMQAIQVQQETPQREEEARVKAEEGQQVEGEERAKAQKVAELTARAQKLAESPEFQKLEPAEQKEMIKEIRNQINKLQ